MAQLVGEYRDLLAYLFAVDFSGTPSSVLCSDKVLIVSSEKANHFVVTGLKETPKMNGVLCVLWCRIAISIDLALLTTTGVAGASA